MKKYYAKITALLVVAAICTKAQSLRMVNPIVLPAVAERTFDTYWINSLTLVAENPAKPNEVYLSARLIPYNTETREMLTSHAKTLEIRDVLSLASTNAHVANAIAQLKLALDVVARERNIID